MELWKNNLDVLREHNPWWVSGRVPADLLGSVRRSQHDAVMEHLRTQRQVLLLEGPRRVGKTTLMYQAIDGLLATAKPDRILYVSVDDPFLNKDTLFRDIQDYFERYVAKRDLRSCQETFYVFLDEITAFEGWEQYVKRYYDLGYPLKFTCTSSAAAMLKERSRESLVGRLSSMQVHPFSLSEVVSLRGMTQERAKVHADAGRAWQAFYDDLDLEQLHSRLVEIETSHGLIMLDELPLRLYLVEGGFPEYIRAESPRYKERYFLESVVERVLFHDMSPIFGVSDLQLLQRLFLYANNQSGFLLNASEAARNLGAPHATVRNYLRCLDAAGLLHMLPKFAASVEAEMRSMDKVYAIDSGLYVSLARISPTELDSSGAWGRLAEIAVLAELRRHGLRDIRHWRDREQELDFAVRTGRGLLAIEVKFRSDPLEPRSLRGLEQFAARFRPEASIVVSKDLLSLQADNTLVVPLWTFLG